MITIQSKIEKRNQNTKRFTKKIFEARRRKWTGEKNEKGTKEDFGNPRQKIQIFEIPPEHKGLNPVNLRKIEDSSEGIFASLPPSLHFLILLLFFSS